MECSIGRYFFLVCDLYFATICSVCYNIEIIEKICEDLGMDIDLY